jgi:hypothetical protein
LSAIVLIIVIMLLVWLLVPMVIVVVGGCRACVHIVELVFNIVSYCCYYVTSVVVGTMYNIVIVYNGTNVGGFDS